MPKIIKERRKLSLKPVKKMPSHWQLISPAAALILSWEEPRLLINWGDPKLMVAHLTNGKKTITQSSNSAACMLLVPKGMKPGVSIISSGVDPDVRETPV